MLALFTLLTSVLLSVNFQTDGQPINRQALSFHLQNADRLLLELTVA